MINLKMLFIEVKNEKIKKKKEGYIALIKSYLIMGVIVWAMVGTLVETVPMTWKL